MKRFSILLTSVSISTGVFSATTDVILTIETPEISKSFTRLMLIDMHIHRISMRNSRAYLNKKIEYEAVKLCDILKPFHILPSDTIELISSDDFAALVPAQYLMTCDAHAAIGYIAIENPDKPWPKLKYNNPDQNHPDDGTAGPLFVIWEHPEKSYISNEYWAWKLVKIKTHHSLNSNDYLPAPKSDDTHIQNGYQAYISRCAGCHTINNIGKGKIGPDLNIPKNATNIFTNDEQLKKFIRDPQSVRPKANDRMSGTNEEFLSNDDLDDLIIYLRYMTEHTQ